MLVRSYLRFTIGCFYISICCVLGGLVYFLSPDWIDVNTFDLFKEAQPSLVLDRYGKVIARFQAEKCDPVTFDQLPDVLVKAFVAAEDHDFFSHCGISLRGILRSVIVNCMRGRIVQGASTITQQLARRMFLSDERFFHRKLREVGLAFQLERQLSKEQILQLYLNILYFGRGIYGVQAACKRFWNKSVSQVTLEQAATLAAVAKSARFYSPLNNIERAQQRRNIILASMCKLGFIDEQRWQQARELPLELDDLAVSSNVKLYIQEWVRSWAEQQWGRDVLYQKGLVIKTTLDSAVQAQAQQAFLDQLDELRQKHGNQINGGLMTIDTTTGGIRAMIGGVDFKQSQFNRAIQASRQLGSAFKPFLYACGLHDGVNMERVFVDEPLEMEISPGKMWKPNNWHKKFEGSMTLVRALAKSNNIITIKLLLELGPERVCEWSKKFGLARCLTPYPSLALGTSEATIEETVAAFNVFANNGVYVQPYLIEHVRDKAGKRLYEHEGVQHRVLDHTLNSKMVNMLTHCMKHARTRYGNDWLDTQTIGKTGSTNGAASMWFIGATPELSTALYIGRDDGRSLGNYFYASKTALPIWVNMHKGIPTYTKQFYIDPRLQEVSIDWFTGQECSEVDSKRVVTVLRD
ncbi:MAG: PBP1A family penicillin-binding protein [Epsilonproteobacteria bacterium]|nr:PBP1A family penicillin-binding protein [Campylobacterota bacterium]